MNQVTSLMPHDSSIDYGLVSVIMPAMNAETTLISAIHSVQAQTYQNWELIVSVDLSTDNTHAVAKNIAETDARIRVLSHNSRQGAAAARNAAIDVAKGAYIAFLDADDRWLPAKMQTQLALMQAKDAAFSCTGFWRISGDSHTLIMPPAEFDHERLLRGNVVGCLTAVYDCRKLGKCYMPNYRRRHDFALWFDILEKTGRGVGLQEGMAEHFRRPTSLSAPLLKSLKGTWHIYRQHLKLDPVRSAYFMSHHLSKRAFSRWSRGGQDYSCWSSTDMS